VCSLDGQVNIGRQPSNWPRTGARDCNSSHLDTSLRQLFNGSHAKEQFIAAAGNTVVPSILALEAAGFQVEQIGEDLLRAASPTGRYVAADPLELLGH